MKTLLAVGCSFTNKNFKSKDHPEIDCSFPKWPEVLGNKLGYNVVNLGLSGNSNDRIFKTTQDYLVNNKVDMICALWTQSTRLNVHDMENCNWNYVTRETSKSLKIFDVEKFLNVVENDGKNNYLKLANEHLRNIFMLDQLSKHNNIPIYHMQGASSFIPEIEGVALSRKRHIKYLHAFVDSKYFNILDEQANIWGWPFYKELGGISMSDFFKQEDIISDIDRHPSARGHEVIANNYFELIESNETN